MLDFGEERTIEWTTVFADHADPYTYWYLPNHVSLDTHPGRDGAPGKPIFQMIEYTGSQGQPKGAFLNLQVRLELPAVVASQVKQRIPGVFSAWIKKCETGGKLTRGSVSGSTITLSVAPWKSGTVECIGFDKRSLRVESAGSEESAKPEAKNASFSFTQSIQGSATPSLDVKNTAIFGLHLSAEGAQLMRATLENPGETMPIGIIYQLKYTGLTPSYSAHISANMRTVYDHLSAKVSGQKKLIKVGITAGLEELIAKEVIEVSITDFRPGKNKEIEAFVLGILRDKIINEWMKPVLTPGELRGMVADPESLDNVIGRDKTRRDAEKDAQGGKDDGGKGDDDVAGDGEQEDVTPPAGGDDDIPPPPPLDDDEIPPPPPLEDDDIPPPPPLDDEDDIPPPPPDDEEKPKETPEKETPEKETPDNSTPDLGKIAKGLVAPMVAGGAAISFEFKAIKQIEDRIITFDLSKREAQQRSFCPQQFLAKLLPSEMSKWQDPAKKTNEYLQRVVFDSAFFDTFPIRVYGLEEQVYTKWAMKAATVTLRYQRSRSGEPEQTKVVPFNKTKTAPVDWQPHLEGSTFGYNVEYVFQDNLSSGWLSKGGKTSYSYSFDKVSGRTVNVSPEELTLIDCEIVPGEDNWESGFKTAAVEVRYPKGGASGPAAVATKTFTVTKGAASQHYRLRVESKDPDVFEYRITYKNPPRALVSPWILSEPGAAVLTISGPSQMPVRFGVGSLDATVVTELQLTVNALEYKWDDKKVLRGAALAQAIDAGEVIWEFPLPAGCSEFRHKWEAKVLKGREEVKTSGSGEDWSIDIEVTGQED